MLEIPELWDFATIRQSPKVALKAELRVFSRPGYCFVTIRFQSKRPYLEFELSFAMPVFSAVSTSWHPFQLAYR